MLNLSQMQTGIQSLAGNQTVGSLPSVSVQSSVGVQNMVEVGSLPPPRAHSFIPMTGPERGYQPLPKQHSLI